MLLGCLCIVVAYSMSMHLDLQHMRSLKAVLSLEITLKTAGKLESVVRLADTTEKFVF